VGFRSVNNKSERTCEQRRPTNREGTESSTVYLPMNSIVLPATTLLHTNSTPFRFGQETTLGKRLGKFLGKNDVPVIEERKRTR